MSIVPLKKITILGLAEEAELITEAVQEVGVMHIINQTTKSSLDDYSTGTTKENLTSLGYIIDTKSKLHMLKEFESFDAETILDEITDMRGTRLDILEQKEIIDKKIELIEPWGRFDFIPKEQIEGNKFWFYIMPHYKVSQISKKAVYSVVAKKGPDSYVLVLAPKEPEHMPIKHADLGHRSLAQLEDELNILIQQLDELKTRRLELTKYRYLLAHNINNVNNEAERLEKEYSSINDGNVFILKGYIGKNSLDEILDLSDEYNLAVYIEEISDKDNAPTLLKNTEVLSGGEELVKFYSVPNYKTLDPSNILFFSFAIFFAMIMSDFGYACVLGIFLLIFNEKMSSNTMGKRIRTLSWFIVFCSMIWGALVGSYFGFTPHGTNAFAELTAKFHKLDINNINAMMKISIYIGVAHICLANLLVAWRHKNSLFALSKIGWGLITVSGAIYIPFIMLGDKSSDLIFEIAKYMVITGTSLVFLFTSNARNIFKRFLDGILGLTKISGAFGDVLSYLRIFALGLASASLGITFNQLASQVIDVMPTFGYIMAIIILVVGHTINLSLGVMGGVVHGLRLNVIEFFNWSISDEGYPFHAFKKTEIKKWIKL